MSRPRVSLQPSASSLASPAPQASVGAGGAGEASAGTVASAATGVSAAPSGEGGLAGEGVGVHAAPTSSRITGMRFRMGAIVPSQQAEAQQRDKNLGGTLCYVRSRPRALVTPRRRSVSGSYSAPPSRLP